LFKLGIELSKRGWLWDACSRWGIRLLIRLLLKKLDSYDENYRFDQLARFAEILRLRPLDVAPSAAVPRYRDVPAEFFASMLGPRRKSSSGWWPSGVDTLATAEDAMLDLTCRRAGIVDGQSILELGCGWGSLCLWLAERYPNSQVTALCDSVQQFDYIQQTATERNLTNLRVLQSEINAFRPESQHSFDRIVSIEMFEQLWNIEEMLARVRNWLKPEGQVFLQMFVHRDRGYSLELDARPDWLVTDAVVESLIQGRIMPAAALLYHFQRDMQIASHWTINGRHYQRTLETWLSNLDASRDQVLKIFEKSMSKSEARWQFYRWRMLLLVCAEIFGYRKGREWFVSHYLLRKREHSNFSNQHIDDGTEYQ